MRSLALLLLAFALVACSAEPDEKTVSSPSPVTSGVTGWSSSPSSPDLGLSGEDEYSGGVAADVQFATVGTLLLSETTIHFSEYKPEIGMTVSSKGWKWTSADGATIYSGTETRIPVFYEAGTDYPLPPTEAEILNWIGRAK